MEMYAQLVEYVNVYFYRLSGNMAVLQPFGEKIMEISWGIEILKEGMKGIIPRSIVSGS
jgi:hypothetical protein